MATPTERKNMIAGTLAKRGVTHNVIIGILCNAYAEAGANLDPFIGENDGTGLNGFGLWQFTSFGGGDSFRSYIVSQVQGKSDLDACAIEANALVDMTGHYGQWTGTTAFSSWLKSGISWQQATSDFCIYWERPANMYGQASSRQQFYSQVTAGLSFDGGKPSGGSKPANPSKPKPKPNNPSQPTIDDIINEILKDKVLTATELQYCMSLFNISMGGIYDKWLH